MKNLFLLISTMFLFQSCDGDEQSNAVVGSIFSISLIDNLGNDLLDPNSTNYYSKDSINIYNLNGELKDYAISHSVSSDSDINAYFYDIAHICNEEELMNGYCKRLWHWNSNEVDTVEVFVKQLNENVYNSYKYRINGVDYNLEGSQSFTIQLIK